MSITVKQVYAAAPATQRGRATVLSVDDKTKTLLAYGSGNNVFMREVKNPLQTEIYTEHSAAVTVAKFSPSGYFLCSGDDNGNVRIWATNNKDKTLKLEVRPISKAIRDICWTFDNQRVITVGEGKGSFSAAFLWDSGSPVGEISGHSANILSCDVRPQRPMRVATGAEDNQVNFYQGPPFKFDHSFCEHKNYVNCVRFSPDGNYFVSVSSDKSVILFDGKTGQKLDTFSAEGGHTASIYSVSWSPDSKFIATASADKTVKTWDVSTKMVDKTFTFGGNSLDLMQVSVLWVAADTLISLSLAGDLYYLDLDNPAQPKRVVNGHNKKIYSLVYDEKTNRFYSSGADGILIRWDLGVGSAGKPAGKGHTNAINTLALQGNYLVTSSVDQSVRWVDLDSFAYTGEEVQLEGLPNDVAVSSVDSDFFVFSTHKNVSFFMGHELKHAEEVKGFEPCSIALSPDNKELALGCSDKKIRIYSLDGFNMTQVALLERRSKVTKLKYSHDGSMLAAGDANREIIVYDVATRAEKYTGLVYHTSQITDLSWSKNNAYLLSGAVDKSMIVWDLANGKRAQADVAHLQGVNAVQFINENTVISAGNDLCIKQWEFAF